jgi:hypothetical protein
MDMSINGDVLVGRPVGGREDNKVYACIQSSYQNPFKIARTLEV